MDVTELINGRGMLSCKIYFGTGVDGFKSNGKPQVPELNKSSSAL